MAPPGRTMPQLLAAKQTPGFPAPISDLETSPCSQHIWNSLCSQQTFDNPLVWHGGHDLKVPLQAVYWGLLSRKWSPDILYPFFPFPLLNFISCIKMTQNIWKDRVCSGSDGKKGEYRWESIAEWFLQFSTIALKKYSDGYEVTYVHSLHFSVPISYIYSPK